jgi:D-3-phosphoglycerate dehydrogenase
VRIGILEPDGFSPLARRRLSALGTVEDYTNRDRAGFLADKEALFVRLAHRVDATFLMQAPQLRYLCSPTTGHTHIDLEALSRQGALLLSLRGATELMRQIRATPEHTLGLIIALLRRYRDAFVDPQNNHWDRDRCRGEEVAGTCIGLIGFGRVGQRLATYLRALDAEIACYDPQVNDVPAHVRQYDSLRDLIGASRVVVLAASHKEGAPAIVDAEAISALAGKYFVNVARGELVDEEALLAAVEGGRLAGCAVDVIRNENGRNNRDRWVTATKLHNIIVTPHIGGATFKSMQMTEEFIAQQLLDTLAGPRRGAL